MGLLTLLNKSGDVFRDEHSLAFDGGDEYINCGDMSSIEGEDDISLGIWVKYLDANPQSFISKGSYYLSGGSFGGYYSPDSGRFRFSLDNGWFAYASDVSANIPLNKWNHIVVTYSNTNDRVFFYFNGVKVTPGSRSGTYSSIPATSHDLYIGRDGTNYGNQKVSEAFIYNTELSDSQVKTLYNGREPYNHKEGIASGNLTAWWRMGDGTFDQKSINDIEGGIVTDMVTPTLGADIFGGKGDFSDPSYWTITSGQSIVENGVAKWLGAGDFGEIKKSSSLTIGQMYRIDFDVNSHNGSGDNAFTLNMNNPYIEVHVGGKTGHMTAYFLAPYVHFRLYTRVDYDVVAEIDNLVVRPVNGNPGAMHNFDTAGDSFKGDTP